MSILKKKLAIEPIQATDNADTVKLFTGLHSEWAKQYGELAQLEVLPASPSSTTDKFKALTQDADGLFYAIGTEYKECQILIELSPKLVENVINSKLGAKPKKGKALTLFDLIVLQPTAETALHALFNLDIIGANSVISGRSINIKTITGADIELNTRQNWICLIFPLATEDDAKDESTTIKIYFAQPMLKTLDAAIVTQQSKATIDPSDPWVNHMRNMIMDTTQMLEVVIEDVNMSIANCTRLELGQIIALPGASHTRLNVNARSTQGVQVLTTSTLGVYKANKAVKLLEDIDPIFLADIADLEQRKSHA